MVYHTDDKGRSINAFIAYPEQGDLNKKYPGLVLIHEWWGCNDYTKRTALKYANQGYVALAVDLYAGKTTSERDEARELAAEVRLNKTEALNNLKSAVSYLEKDPRVDEARLASIGWCFGGAWSYQMAKNNLGVLASVIYYGNFDLTDDLSMMQAKILGHFAEKDIYIKVEDVREFQTKLGGLSSEHEVYIYPKAQHAFTNSEAMQVYDAEATKLAFTRTLSFLHKHA